MTTAQTSPALAAISAATAPKATTQADDPEQRFLRLLVTQVRNQDPLNPLDNAQMTSQLAQLNVVAGVNRLNATLGGLVSAVSASQSLTAANTLGRGVLVAGDRLVLAGNADAVFAVELPSRADTVTVRIRDAGGRVVHTATVGPQAAGAVMLGWDGTLDGGGRAPDGTYTFSAEAAAGGSGIDVKPLSYGVVTGVNNDAAGVRLNVRGLGEYGLADVRQIN